MPEDNHQPEVSQASEVYSSKSQPYGSETDAAETAVAEILPRESPKSESIAWEGPASTPSQALATTTVNSVIVPIVSKPPPPPPPPPPPDSEEEDESPEDRGMLRMSFMEHLEELRTRLLRAVMGIVVAFVLSLTFCKPLWNIVSAPAVDALKHLGLTPKLIYTAPMDGFNIIYIKLPLLMSVFVGAPWILYQVWAFISPGLYKREKRWAVPFVAFTAGLFIAGGCFAYFVAFRFGLEFLLGIGRDINVSPMVTINEYFDLFVNVTLGVGLVFELPVIIFFLTLLRLASPRFLLRHSRYAILGIAILAAAVTPTPDAFNMMIFAVPMVVLYFLGLFASYLLVLNREGKSFPWKIIWLSVLGLLLLSAGAVAVMIYEFHFHYVPHWPFLVK